ncbi:MAG: hypothetical protein KDA24_23055, partial [Deltaproteobacteria bacterium]|nr:hypothetical protein [Deltaproteobacteria bacterium]
MNADAPFPPLSLAWPWLAGQGGALLVVVVVSLVVARRSRPELRGTRLGALGWALAATLMPVAWLVARWLPEWLGDRAADPSIQFCVGLAAGALLHGFAAWVSIYLADLGGEADRAREERRSRARAREAARPAQGAQGAASGRT